MDVLLTYSRRRCLVDHHRGQLWYIGHRVVRPSLRAVELVLCCSARTSRIRQVRNPCAQHHPACPNHARTACSCSHELRPTCCSLCRHLDDTWSSPPPASRCRGLRLRRASESKVEMSRSAARYAPSWPRPRRPSPWHAPCTREPLSGPGMGRSLLALLTSHGTRSLPMCPGTRRPRSCPSTCVNPGVSTTAGLPASSTRVQEQEWRRSELLGSRTVAHCDRDPYGESMWWVQLGGGGR